MEVALAPPQAQGNSDEVAILRHELATLRTQMQTYIEQLETSNEELLALNQEQLSSNEEFQSTNEELETSHEELQSSFEEVQAAYAELHASNEALEQSQFKLRKAEANVWALINNTLQAFVLVDSKGEIVAFNQQAVLLFQRLSGCLLAPGQSFRSCLVQDSQDALLTELGKALKGEVCSGEELVQTSQSGPIWLAYSFTPAQANSQGAQAVSVSLLDISERVLAQQGLQTQSQRFKALIENSFDGIAICQNFGIYSYISPAIERLVGYRAEEMLFHHSGEFIHPDDLAEMGRIFANLHLKPSQASQLQWRQRHKSGEWRWFEGVAVNSLDVPGIEGTILNFRDVTERLLQEQAVRLSEVRLRQIIDLIPAYIYARDSLNRCVLANAMTARLFNLSPQELEGKRFDELPALLPENDASLQADQAVREQGVLRILPEFSFGSGQARQQLSSYKIPYTASDSGHPATLTVTMDLTGFKTAT